MEQMLLRRPWLVPLALLLLALILLRPAVLPADSRHALDGNDFTGNFYPLYTYTAEQVANGELPLWNPRQFIGFPVAGNPQAALFYPPTWGIWLLYAVGVSVERGIGLMVVLHTALAAWGAAMLARRFGSTWTAALIAGVIYSMSGWSAARIYAGHYTIITAYAWIPWVLLTYHTVLTRRTFAALIPAIAALGMTALAGHPQMLLYAGLGMVMLWGYHVYTADERMAAARDGLIRLVMIALGGAILGMALLLPTAELVRLSPRAATDLDFVNKFHLPASQLLTLALPFLYGNPKLSPSYYWGADFVEETTAYAGLLALVALALCVRYGTKRIVFWLILVIVGVVLALGADGVLYALLVRWVPGFDLFRSPGRFLFFTTFGLAGLTAALITHLQTATPDRRRVTLAPALRVVPVMVGVLLAFSLFFSGWYASASHVEPMPHRAAQVAGVTGFAGLILLATWGVLWLYTRDESPTLNTALVLTLLLVIWDVWHVAVPIITTSDITDKPLWNGAVVNVATGTESRVRAYVDPNNYFPDAVNNASRTGHLHVLGYDPLEISAYTTLLSQVGDDPNNPFYDLVGLRYVLSWEPRDDGWDLIGVAEGGIYYENPDPFPRAWVASEGVLQPDDAAARDQILSGELDLKNTVLLSEPLDCELNEGESSAQITEYRANDVTIAVNSPGGVLVLSDQYYPGWRARVDDTFVPIRRAYTTLRAVCVPPGEHTVTLSYRPRSVLFGAVISGMGWIVLGLLWLRSRFTA